MKYTLTLAVLLAALAGPAMAGGGLPPSKESCDTLVESADGIRKMAADHRASVVFLDGEAAHRFLDAVRPAGSRLLLQADHVAVLEAPFLNAALIQIADNLCGGYGSSFSMEPADIRDALAAAKL